MKKLIILLLFSLHLPVVFSQKINYYQDGVTGVENLRVITQSSGFIHTFDTRYQGIKGTPNLFNSFVPSYLLLKGKEKYFQLDSDIDLLRNSVIFLDPATGKTMEIPAENVSELIFIKYDKEIVFRTTKGIKFNRRVRETKFYQVMQQEPHQLIMVTYKTFTKADSEPVFNSGQNYDEFKSKRKFFIEDSKGVFHQVVLNKVDYDYLIHPTQLNRKSLAKIFPDKKDKIYRAFDENSGPVSADRIIEILNKF